MPESGEKTQDERRLNIRIIDDDMLVAEVLAGFLRDSWHCDVTINSDVASARAALKASGPVDLVLADYRLPGNSGLTFVKDLVALNHPHPVVVISGKIGPEEIHATLAAGAKGFISKRIGVLQMLRRLAVVLDGETYIPPSIFMAAPSRPYVTAGVSLTDRERQVLKGAREGLSNKEIARELSLSDITVKLHMRAILKKFGMSNRTQLAMMDLGDTG